MKDTFLNIHCKVTKPKTIFTSLVQNIHNDNHHWFGSSVLDTVQGNGGITVFNPHNSLLNWML